MANLRILRIFLIAHAVTILACHNGAHKEVVAAGNSQFGLCTPSSVVPIDPNIVTFDEHVKPLVFQKICAECHGAIAGLPNWLDYSQAFARRDIILQRLNNRTMPPPTATINTLTPEEIGLVQKWVDGGAIKTAGLVPCPDDQQPPVDPVPPVILDPPPPEFPTYSQDVMPKIFQPLCGSCHGVDPKLPNWLSYAVAFKESDKIVEKVTRGEMPPPITGIKLTDNQKKLIILWVEQGAVY